MLLVKEKFEYGVEVYFDGPAGSDEEYVKEEVSIISGEEGFSEEELTSIAKQVGGYYAENYRVIKSWFETV